MPVTSISKELLLRIKEELEAGAVELNCSCHLPDSPSYDPTCDVYARYMSNMYIQRRVNNLLFNFKD